MPVFFIDQGRYIVSRKFVLLCGILLYAFVSFAQPKSALNPSWSNKRIQLIPTPADTITLDSLSMIPGSLTISRGKQYFNPDHYYLDPYKARFLWKGPSYIDSLLLTYRVFPYALAATFKHKDIGNIDTTDEALLNPFIYSPFSSDQQLFDFGKLDYNGSFSRGISFGNKQDVVVNSDFNLQLSGMLSEDVEVIAAMTDNNIPIQPEGNTQQIQEFDKIFIKLKKGQQQLTMGDFVIKRPASHFMNFTRKVKGGQYQTRKIFDKKKSLGTGTSLALARGKYNRMQFVGQEGNQGPYRLKGANDENFIIIMAGTERVYVDGLLMERGLDHDYIIDYNSAEVTFTPNRLITKDIRIVIEFEYSNQNFTRSLLHHQQSYRSEKLTMTMNIFSEQDHKNQPIQIVDESRKKEIGQVLNEAGDSLHQAFLPGGQVVKKVTDRVGILYEKIDTVGSWGRDSVFVHSTDTTAQLYRVSFTKVGEGKGNYEIASATVNGRVYEWIAPVNGQLSGSFEPIILLVAPQKRQMIAFGTSYQLDEDQKVYSELALSNFDLNTGSSKDRGDNTGAVAKVGYEKQWTLGETAPTTLSTGVDYEYTNKYFTPIELYRTVEFSRDWNLPRVLPVLDQHMGSAGLTFSRKHLGKFNYQFSNFLMEKNTYNGYRHVVNSNLSRNGFRMILRGSYLQSAGEEQRSKFLRPFVNISKNLPKWKDWRLGVVGEQEENKRYNNDADTLDAQSFRFDRWNVYLQKIDSAGNELGINYGERYDRAPVSEGFRQSTLGQTLTLNGGFFNNPRNRLKWGFTFRKLEISDSTLTTQKAEESLLSRVEYNLVAAKGLFNGNTFYEIGTGQEQKREFEFLPVQEGVGTHTWTDYDKDGVQDLNEFEIAVFQDQAEYIKIFTPTDEFQKVRFIQFSQNLSVNPRAIWHSKTGLRKLISRFNTQSFLQINRKVFDNADVSPFNPFVLEVEDTTLVSLSSSARNVLYFNRTSPVFGMDLRWNDNRNKSVLTSGFESRIRQEVGSRARLNLSKSITTELKVDQGIKSKDIFSRRDYEVNYSSVEPKVTLIYKNILRASVFYNYLESKNHPDYGGEVAFSNKFTADVRYNVVSKSALNVSFSYASVVYDFPNNTPVAFVILQGLEPGNNFLWNVSLERKLSGNLQLSLTYDGRKIADNQTVHIGGAQVRALF